MKPNNIDLIYGFIKENSEKLLINQVNQEIGCFYEAVIRRLSKKFDTQLLYNSDLIYDDNNDLFGGKKVFIHQTNSSKQIEEISNTSSHNIIFTDYKNYKKFSRRFVTVNGYEFEKDMKYYFETFLKINNNDLLNYCLSFPHLIFSEISKYKVNNINFTFDYILNEEKNFILNIRKDIFKLKTSNIDVKQLLHKLKTEVRYKKFSFLTY